MKVPVYLPLQNCSKVGEQVRNKLITLIAANEDDLYELVEQKKISLQAPKKAESKIQKDVLVDPEIQNLENDLFSENFDIQ